MRIVIFEEVEQISAEMKAIVNQSEKEGRRLSREEHDALEQLTKDRDVLLGDTIFHGYV